MKKHKTIMIKHPKLISFKCDRCKKELIDNELEIQEVHSVEFMGGYNSVFGDGVFIQCDLCQHCLKELIGKFCIYDYGE